MVTPPRPSAETRAGIRRAASAMATSATARVERRHSWFADLSPEDRSWIGVIAQGGIMSFIGWLDDPQLDEAGAVDVFSEAPRELTRSITLEHTLDLIRTVIEVVEDEAPVHAVPTESAAIREAVLHYSREVAFAAAHVYARAAESRGAWDARLESLVVDAVVRGDPDDALGSRVNALGWADVQGVCVVVGTSPHGDESSVVDPLRRSARRAGLDLLVSVEGRRLIAILGGVDDPLDAAREVAGHFGDGPVVCGPVVPHLYSADQSAQEAVRGFDAAAAATGVQRPVHSDALLAERAVAGDDAARRRLAHQARTDLEGSTALGETARTYLAEGSLEATARALFVHANTVRYRLGRITETTGWDLTNPCDAFTARLAIMLAELTGDRAPQDRHGDAL